jgi:hypothetical protein
MLAEATARHGVAGTAHRSPVRAMQSPTPHTDVGNVAHATFSAVKGLKNAHYASCFKSRFDWCSIGDQLRFRHETGGT